MNILISKEELKKLYLTDKLSDQKISDKVGIKRRDISRHRKYYGIMPIEDYHRSAKQQLTAKEKEIILGLILGDGHIRRRGKNKAYPSLMLAQSAQHSEYLFWLKEQLKDWVYNPNKEIKIKKRINNITHNLFYTLSFDTICHPVFNEFYYAFYKNGKKVIDFNLLEKYFSDVTLAIWLMDDGGLTGKQKRTRLCTNSFTEEEVNKLRDFLFKKYNFKTWIVKSKTKKLVETGEIHFDKRSTLELTRIVKDIVVPSMRYKLLYNNVPELIIKNNRIDINKKDWKKINEKYNKIEIKDGILDVIYNKKMSFPYKEISLHLAEQDFKNLIKLDEKELLSNENFKFNLNYKYNKINQYVKQRKIGNISSDYFQQINRFNCSYRKSPSPIEIWNSRKRMNYVLNYLWSMKREMVNDDVFRGSLRLRSYTASQFKPSVAKYIYNTYGNNGDVLDFSAGWGDRLAGFYASNCKRYVGIDPNISVCKSYNEQMKLYEQYNHKEVEIINKAAEDVDLEDKQFDLVFTSPPYFDLERYSNENNQSWIRYKTLDEWLNKFLFSTINNAWNHLKNGGYIILNISDVNSGNKIQHICDPMNDYISVLKGAIYQGAIGMKMSKRPNNKNIGNYAFCEPIWIWRKS